MRIYLQVFTGHDDARRYQLLQTLFELPERPESSKQLTKGQASALIGISRHPEYGPVLYEHLHNLA